jgi:hypothetical protein
MKKFWVKILESFNADVYPPATPVRQYISDAERRALMLTAEGNVYLAMGAVCTKEEVVGMKKKVLAYVR